MPIRPLELRSRSILVLRGANSVTYSVAQVSNLLYRRLPSRQIVLCHGACGFGNPRYSRFGNLRYVIVFAPACTELADFEDDGGDVVGLGGVAGEGADGFVKGLDNFGSGAMAIGADD